MTLQLALALAIFVVAIIGVAIRERVHPFAFLLVTAALVLCEIRHLL